MQKSIVINQMPDQFRLQAVVNLVKNCQMNGYYALIDKCKTVSYHLKNQFDNQYHIVHDNNTYSLEKLDSINDLGVIFLPKEILFIWMNPVLYYYTNQWCIHT